MLYRTLIPLDNVDHTKVDGACLLGEKNEGMNDTPTYLPILIVFEFEIRIVLG